MNGLRYGRWGGTGSVQNQGRRQVVRPGRANAVR